MKIMRLLLVDDEANFRVPLKKRLEKRGCAVLEAGSGDECLVIMGQERVEVVVLDVKMPGMNGIEVLQWIKENHHQTEVILLTGQASASDGVEGIKHGAFDYLTKPVEFEHLFQKIGQAFEKRQREEEKRQEMEFKARMDKQMIATERLASLGTLSTGVAHEIDNPLAIIKESAGYMRLVLNRPENESLPARPQLENAIEKIETAIERAKRITHQLLGVVRKPEAVCLQTDLKELVAETIELAGKAAKTKNIAFVQDLEKANSVIWSDPYAIRQVLLNLLNNGIAAVGSAGTITVSIHDMGARVGLSVEDTGEGIPIENLDKIFEPFFTTKPPGQGTGLGLYVTAGIVNRLGGGIDVSSRVGRGTVFQVVLPRSPDAGDSVKDNKDICDDILSRIKGDAIK